MQILFANFPIMCHAVVMTGIERAINKAGGVNKLATQLGFSRQRVSHWHKTGKVPMDHILQVSNLTNVPARLLIKDWFT